MESYHTAHTPAPKIFVGVDVHKKNWQVSINNGEGELFSGRIPGEWEALRRLLARYADRRITVAYEAGFSGYWLHDQVVAYGASCVVTPPSLLPVESGNRVKTDRRDSRKLAFLLSIGMLKSVWVPDAELRTHREVVRRRSQLVRDRVRTQLRIKAELAFYGIVTPLPSGKWSRRFIEGLYEIRFPTVWAERSFRNLLEEFERLEELVDRQTALLRELAASERYRRDFDLLCSMPGIGLVTAMEFLVEVGDIARFGNGERLAAFVGLTPAQYSSGEQTRMGRITGIGRSSLRAALVEAAWRLIRQSPSMRIRYERLRHRAGAKRAVVATARKMVLIARRMLLDGQPYREPSHAGDAA